MGVSKSEQIARGGGRGRDPKGGDKSAGGTTAFRFVNIELTAEQKEDFKALLAAGEFNEVCVDDWTRLGYKVSFTSGDAGKTSICSVVCGVEGDPNHGQILTGRGGDSTTALRVAAYKDTYLCEDGVWGTSPNLRGGAAGDIG